LRRGMKEEAGIEIEVGRYLGIHRTPTSGKIVRWYECFASSDEVTCGSDLEDIRWVPKDEVAAFCGERVRDYWPREIREYFG